MTDFSAKDVQVTREKLKELAGRSFDCEIQPNQLSEHERGQVIDKVLSNQAMRNAIRNEHATVEAEKQNPTDENNLASSEAMHLRNYECNGKFLKTAEAITGRKIVAW